MSKIKHLATMAVLLLWQVMAEGRGNTASPIPEKEDFAKVTQEANDGIQRPDEGCFSKMICQLKEKVRWRTPAWTQEQCDTVAKAVLDSSRKHHLSPGLIQGIALNESDWNEQSVREYKHGDKLYAADSGLMGIRCMFDMKALYPKRGKGKKVCTNNWVKGMTFAEVMDPTKNIEIASRQLEFWKNGGATVIAKIRDEHGHMRPKMVPCQHKDHAFWQHYNNGPHYISHGPARHYAHRVAVLDYAIAEALGLGIPRELLGPISIQDKGQKPRQVNKPVGIRQRTLFTKILACSGVCSRAIALKSERQDRYLTNLR